MGATNSNINTDMPAVILAVIRVEANLLTPDSQSFLSLNSDMDDPGHRATPKHGLQCEVAVFTGGVYQIGEDQARSWSVAGIPSGTGIPLFTES